MIHGIGVDLVRIPRIEEGLRRFGDRYATRILSESELNEYRRAKSQDRFLAMRFAAKEALAKALGTGFRQGVTLRSISVIKGPAGRPLLSFSGATRELLEKLSITASHLSLSDEGDYAVACVTLECR